MLRPLADQLRPESLDEIVGQDHLLKTQGFLRKSIENQKPLSFILWGPPGTGKTSIARVYGKAFPHAFHKMNATTSGVGDLKKIIENDRAYPLFSKGMILFVDEIHRFSKAQQDAFLPHIEDGTIVLIGATAENPSFYLNDALLSRVRVLQVNHLSDEALKTLYLRVEPPLLTEEGLGSLITLAQGDGRAFLNFLETLQAAKPDGLISAEHLHELVHKGVARSDKAGDHHYQQISSLHKAIRGSDPDAALYWLSRMLDGGQDPLFLLRRMIRAAAEDVGLADPHALPFAISCRDAFQMLGSPEGELMLAELAVYLALAPKSNAIYTAFSKARELASKTSHLSPQAFSMNASTRLMKELGFGKGYAYDHDVKEGCSGQNYFPEGIERHVFYQPVMRGFERELNKRLVYFNGIREKSSR